MNLVGVDLGEAEKNGDYLAMIKAHPETPRILFWEANSITFLPPPTIT